MIFGSVCSGIGGLDLGLERAGMKCAWQCEINPFCRKVLAKHWPGLPLYHDITKITTAPYMDLLCGGFPCQPHSVAGKQKGDQDERDLWPECIRLVRLFRPRWCLFENVPGLLTTMFGQVVTDLRGAGYTEWPLFLGADDVGANHRRKRIWIVAYAQQSGTALAVPPPKRRNSGSVSGPAQSSLGSSTHGFPRRLAGLRRQRLKALGNGVVPLCAEVVGRAIMYAEWRARHAVGG